jgi:hypothetical protein
MDTLAETGSIVGQMHIGMRVGAKNPTAMAKEPPH